MSGALGTGRRLFLGIADELNDGYAPLNHSAYELFDPVLPANWRGLQPEVSVGTVNRSGVPSQTVPGRVSLPVSFGVPLTAPHLRRYYYHLLGKVTRTVLTPGVYQHVFELETLEHPDRTLSLLAGIPPIDRSRVDGLRLRQMVLSAQAGQVMQARFEGLASHTTRMGPPEADEANTGTHLGPRLRGPLRDEDAGDVFVKVVRSVGEGGLRWRVEQVAAAPAFAGADVNLVANPEVSAQTPWQLVQGADGIDLGFSGSNWTPLEIQWGPVASLGTLETGDIFRFRRPATWSAPTLTIQPAARVFSHPHVRIKTRVAGSADEFYVHEREQITFTLVNGVVDRGAGEGRYPNLYRPGETTAMLVFSRPYTDPLFERMVTQHERLEVALELLGGAQIGATVYRETVEIVLASCGIPAATRQVQNAGPVQEGITLQMQQPSNSQAPISIRTVCETDWTAPA